MLAIRSAHRMVGLWVFLLALVLATRLVSAQEEFYFDRLTVDQGLPSNSVNVVMQNRQGFLWVGSQNGLNRYDGYEFRDLRQRTPEGDPLDHLIVTALFEDAGEQLWVGTQKGLLVLDASGRVIRRYRHDSKDSRSLSSSDVSAVLRDSNGDLWVGTNAAGLCRQRVGDSGFAHYRSSAETPGRRLADDGVNVLYEAPDGHLWAGTDGGLCRFDPERNRFACSDEPGSELGALGGLEVRAIHHDSSGVLWVGTWGDGLFAGRPEGGRIEPLDGEWRRDLAPFLSAIVEDVDGALWIGSRRGLIRLDSAARSWRLFQHDPEDPTSLGDNFVIGLFVDRSGLLWVATYGGGLNRLRRLGHSFVRHRTRPGDASSLPSDRVMAVTEDDDGHLYVATFGGGLARLDSDSGEFTQFDPDAIGSEDIRAVHFDREGRLWFGTQSGVLGRVDTRSGSVDFPPFAGAGLVSPATGNIMWIGEDRKGRLWIGTYEAGLCRFDDVADSVRCEEIGSRGGGSPPVATINVVAEDGLGRLWLGTPHGVIRFDPESGRSVAFDHQPGRVDGPAAGEVGALHIDRRGALWIGTEAGWLTRFDEQADDWLHFRHDPLDPESLGPGRILAIHEDRRGTLWVGTWGGGVCRLDSDRQSFRCLRKDPGNPTSLSDDNVRVVFEDRQGAIWVGTWGGGLNLLRSTEEGRWPPASAQASVDIAAGPPVVLTSFKKLNENFPMETDISETDISRLDRIELAHDDLIISFEFAALDYHDPKRNQFSYMLEGLHERRIDLGVKRDITFTTLDPGDYTLRVWGSDSRGHWNEAGLSLRLVVTPPFWQAWWFRVAAGALLSGFLVGGHKLRTRTIRSRNLLLEEMNTKLNGEIAERRKAEAEREESIGELEKKNTELERFAYTVSHDLKSPLVTIRGFAGVLERSESLSENAEARADLERITQAADRMGQLLDELLQLSRLGRQVNPRETVWVGDLVQETIELLHSQVARSGVEVVICESLPRVSGDRTRLGEIFQNLIDNSIKFMGQQENPRVVVSAREKDGEVLCSVADNGIGVDEAYRVRIFGLFERLDPGTEGVGVGLAIVQRIVELHGGRIWVESEGEGMGSTFWFTLPAA